jgi:hypothetical protein
MMSGADGDISSLVQIRAQEHPPSTLLKRESAYDEVDPSIHRSQTFSIFWKRVLMEKDN